MRRSKEYLKLINANIDQTIYIILFARLSVLAFGFLVFLRLLTRLSVKKLVLAVGGFSLNNKYLTMRQQIRAT